MCQSVCHSPPVSHSSRMHQEEKENKSDTQLPHVLHRNPAWSRLVCKVTPELGVDARSEAGGNPSRPHGRLWDCNSTTLGIDSIDPTQHPHHLHSGTGTISFLFLAPSLPLSLSLSFSLSLSLSQTPYACTYQRASPTTHPGTPSARTLAMEEYRQIHSRGKRRTGSDAIYDCDSTLTPCWPCRTQTQQRGIACLKWSAEDWRRVLCLRADR